jgi:hypothetical protein
MSLDPLFAGVLAALVYSHIIAFALGRLSARRDNLKVEVPHHDGEDR